MKFDGVAQVFSVQSVLDGLNIGVLALNPQMEIVFTNRQALHILGVKKQYPRGTKCYRVLPVSPRDTMCRTCPVQRTFADGSTHAKIQPRQACGNTQFLRVTTSPLSNAEGEITAVLLSVEDFSEHLKVTEELRQSRDFYLKLFDEFPNPIWRAGTDGKCDYFNTAWLEFTGRTIEQEMGDGWAEGVHPDDLDNCVTSYMEAFRQRRPFFLQYRLRNHTGEYHFIHDYGRPFFDNRGQFIGYVGSCYDVQEIKEAEAALVRSGQLSAVGVLAAGIAHEYNNLLTPVMGYTNMIMSRDNVAPDIRKKLEYIKQAAERAAEISSKMLSFARPANFPQATCGAAQVARDMLDLIKPQLRTDEIDVKLIINPAPMVAIDRILLGQVIMNLLINADHAVAQSAQKTLTLEIGEKNKQVFVRVSDTGCSIAKEDLSKIFLPFFSAKGEHAQPGSPLSNFKGLGLGLSVCNSIVSKHGGRIAVESQPERGTTFTVFIPAAKHWETPVISETGHLSDGDLSVLHAQIEDDVASERKSAPEALRNVE